MMPPGMARLALVTGATGFMAQHLVPDLIEGGWEVRASGRRGRPASLPREVAYEAADLTGERGLEALCEGADTVFHLAGATSSLSSTEEMHESNVVATTNLVLGKQIPSRSTEAIHHARQRSCRGGETAV